VCGGFLPGFGGILPSLQDSRGLPAGRKSLPNRSSYAVSPVSPFWIWTQVAIVVFVLIGMIIAITKLA
jgi:hypothetical protein